MFVCMFELYRRLNGGTDFLKIFTVASSMSGRSFRLLFMLKFQNGEVPRSHNNITYYCKLIKKWVYWKNYNSKISQISV